MVSNTMRNKTNKQKQNKTVRKIGNKLKAMKVSTPFGDAGRIVGRTIGSMFGNGDIGSGVGKWLGTGIGSIFGSGDYTMAGAAPSYNVLTNNTQIPKFSTGRQTNIVCHREYLGDIYGTTAFDNKLYPLNPGMSETFPWLSSVAGNYSEYRFHGLIFEFRPLTTDYANAGVPGVIVMSTNYNSDDPAYINKQQMENAEYAVSTKPTEPVIHGVECAPHLTIDPTKSVRTDALPAGKDVRNYDLGLFQLATQNNSAAVDLGELWVSYCVEFFKPQLPTTIQGGSVDHFVRSSTTGLTALGIIQVAVPLNQLGCTLTSNVLTFPAGISGTYQVDIYHIGTAAVFGGFGVPVAVNGTVVTNVFNNSTAAFAQAPSGVSTASINYTTFIQINPSSLACTLTFGAIVGPTNSYVDVYVTSVTTPIR